MKSKGRILRIGGLLLIAAALCLTGYNVWETKEAGKTRDAVMEQLDKLLPTPEPTPRATERAGTQSPVEAVPTEDPWEGYATPTEIVYPDYVLNPKMEMPVKTIDGYDYIGVLWVEKEDLSIPILSTWDYKRLKINPCRYAGSVYENNLVLAAHNYATHFGWLYTAAIGDEVTFTDMDGNVFRYRVAEIEQLRPSERERMIESEWPLTCYTCSIGNRTRLAIRCEKTEG